MNQNHVRQIQYLDNVGQINDEIKKKEEKLINSQSPRKLTKLIQKADNIFDQVQTPSAMSHDFNAFKQITHIAFEQVSSTNLGPMSLNITNIGIKLTEKFSSNENNLDFEKIGEWALRKSKVAPEATTFLFGLGQFQPIHKERQRGVRSQKDKIEEMRSVDLKEMKENRSDTLVSRAKKLCERLKKNGDTAVSNVITAPSSFAQTVENAFDLAHLVRDGRVGITAEDGIIKATTEINKIKAGDTRKQCILHLRQPEYKQIIEQTQNTSQLMGDF